MAEYERSRAFDAPPELVFDEASDPDTMDQWLPGEVHLESADLPEVTVEHGSERERALMRAERDQLRVEWGTRDTGEYAGWLQVTGIDPDRSEAVVHLSFFDEEHAPPRSRIEQELAESLDRLTEKVRHRSERSGG
ncbi:SRPBCC family protein [Actinoallomurus rhizosphaericola]|uniref:SRPBCC family protein n=1 Tax=Actinoallomurus rhizosphaericola TaxID=2952536 RepID=UPI0020926F7A|nr:SRPBCC family protein [Actinoallomurus rhizosphaericola]MCO5999497.1 SRPBCC family protein [Actinoallomurus rhizosphaericola]